jgi:hypothetical protein
MYEDPGAAEALGSVDEKTKGTQALADDNTKRIEIRP